MCLTEHMPRYDPDHLYPEEIESQTTLEDLDNTFTEFVNEARRLQVKFASKIRILVGMETEGMNEFYWKKITELQDQHSLDFIVGSLHHVNEIPIDFNQELWSKAQNHLGGTQELYLQYFKTLNGFIKQVKPTVIGHLDLIRLYSPKQEHKFDLPEIDSLVNEIVKNGVKVDCLFELNSSAIRKGWGTPYPQRDVVSVILREGGKLCLSDDSHNIDQVALNYEYVYEYLKSLNVPGIYKLDKKDGKLVHVFVPLSEFAEWLDSK